MFTLGVYYSVGFGVNRDISKAKEYFKQSCDKNLKKACEVYETLKD